MAHFRVELDAKDFRSELQGDRDAVLVFAEHRSAGRGLLHGVAVAHPDLRGGAQAGKEGVIDAGNELSGAVFPGVAGSDNSAQFFGQQLHSITHSENGDVQPEQVVEINVGSPFLRDTPRSATQNDGGRGAGLFQLMGLIETREKTLLPDAAHDELGVLRAEVDDGDVLRIHGRKFAVFSISVFSSRRFAADNQDKSFPVTLGLTDFGSSPVPR